MKVCKPCAISIGLFGKKPHVIAGCTCGWEGKKPYPMTGDGIAQAMGEALMHPLRYGLPNVNEKEEGSV